MNSSARAPGAFQVVIPVKDIGRAKSRLDVDPSDRRDLALAFALDVLTASAACSLVEDLVVVTCDQLVADMAMDRGAYVLTPPPGGSLNHDLTWGLEELRCSRPTAVLMSDLPSLGSEELDDALSRVRAQPGTCYVEDLHTGGTTLLGSSWGGLVPQFGTGSAMAYKVAGATTIGSDLVSLRCDVDDVDGLRMAARIGVGAHTSALLRKEQFKRVLTDTPSIRQ